MQKPMPRMNNITLNMTLFERYLKLFDIERYLRDIEKYDLFNKYTTSIFKVNEISITKTYYVNLKKML